ncbi:hypothetical protein H311_00934 [Anncaliia algerae PRA109]|nr:hypothetical protein H311_00934 [Anncaliia algerae PRA109]
MNIIIYFINKAWIFHNTICHKYKLINKRIGVRTHTVESFNNELKLEIKRRRIKTSTEKNFRHMEFE